MSIILIPVDGDSTASASAISNDTVGSDLIAIQVFPDTLKIPSIQESVTRNNETMNMFLLTTKPSDTENDSKFHLESLIQSAPSSKAEADSLVTPQNIQKPFRCKFCNKKFVFRRTLKMHKKIHFLQKSASSNKSKFSETSDDDDDDDNCITDEEGIEDTSLDVCADLNPCISSNIKTLEKPFECAKCGERFLLKPSLKLHNDIHLYESSAVNINDVDARIDEDDVTLDECTDLSSSNIQTLEKPFECKKCGERFLLKTSLKKHNDIHLHHADNHVDPEGLDDDDTKIDEKVMSDTSTDACGNSSPCIPSNILLEKPFVCKQCGERFFLRTSLKKHCKIHVLENIETFASSNYTKNSTYILCSENSDNDNNKIGEKVVGDTSLAACADLSPFPSSVQLKEQFECEKSGEKFSSKTSLKELNKINLSESHHSTVSINDVNNSVYIFCSENSKNDNNKADEKAMEVTILDPCPNSSQCIPCNMQGLEKPFKCKKCGERFLLKTSLKKHNKIHSYDSHYSSISTNDTENSVDSEEIYGCDKCGKVFMGENSFEAHLRKHTEKNNECNICQRKFKSVAVLRNHMHLHTKGMIHVCGICKKSFFSQSILEAHVMKHRAVKLYICEICKKSFSDKTKLTVHVQIHIEEKSYKCPICNLMCFSLSSLKQHVMTH